MPQHVLRFWESRFAQIKPVKRAGGRRYYRPEDVDLLRGIRALLYSDGLTIKGVQKVLRERGPRYVTELGRGAARFAIAERMRGGESGDRRVPREREVQCHPFRRDDRGRDADNERAPFRSALLMSCSTEVAPERPACQRRPPRPDDG